MRPFSTGGPDRRMSLRLLFCYLRLAANCSNCAAAVPAGKAWIRTSKTRSNPPGEVAEVPCTGGIRRNTGRHSWASIPAVRSRSAGRSARIREERHSWFLRGGAYTINGHGAVAAH